MITEAFVILAYNAFVAYHSGTTISKKIESIFIQTTTTGLYFKNPNRQQDFCLNGQRLRSLKQYSGQKHNK